MSTSGKVKWFNGAKGFGFISREGNEKDVFVHISAVKAAGLRDLQEGDQITFDIDMAAKGPCAVNLQKAQFSNYNNSIKYNTMAYVSLDSDQIKRSHKKH